LSLPRTGIAYICRYRRSRPAQDVSRDKGKRVDWSLQWVDFLINFKKDERASATPRAAGQT
jgi:hypothetical protein